VPPSKRLNPTASRITPRADNGTRLRHAARGLRAALAIKVTHLSTVPDGRKIAA
jgi:hypothetical protein